MNWAYDGEADALLVELVDGSVASQRHMGDGVIVDLAADGGVVAVEIMNPASPWDAEAIIAAWPVAFAGAAGDLLRNLAGWSPARLMSDRGARHAGGSMSPHLSSAAAG